jgi:hypothetical protein
MDNNFEESKRDSSILELLDFALPGMTISRSITMTKSVILNAVKNLCICFLPLASCVKAVLRMTVSGHVSVAKLSF